MITIGFANFLLVLLVLSGVNMNIINTYSKSKTPVDLRIGLTFLF